MANPRDFVDFEGIDEDFASYEIDGATITYDRNAPGGSQQVGKAVQLTAARTVGLTADASDIEGRLERVEPDGKATVRFKGYMTLPGSGTVTLGTSIVGAANGTVRSVNTTVAAELGVARGRVIDPTTLTAVLVRL